MPRRTFILLIAVVVVFALAILLFFALRSNLFGGDTTTVDNAANATAAQQVDGSQDGDANAGAEEPNVPPPTPTPVVTLEEVVIVKNDLPVGTRLTRELLEFERRPSTNIALQGGYTFHPELLEDLEGRILRVSVAQGEALLRPMLALEPNDLTNFGSDLSLYIDRGEVAVAFPVNEFNGASLAMRPGDLVDMLMTVRVIEIDPEFKTALPNTAQRVIESALLAGEQFLFDPAPQGRLEFIPEINQTVEIIPLASGGPDGDFEAGSPIPKRVTQLTVQQAEVLWVGTWQDPREIEAVRNEQLGSVSLSDVEGNPDAEGEEGASDAAATDGGDAEGDSAAEAQQRDPVGSLLPDRFETTPDVVILSMSAQDALALKWARERGVDIDIALRAQGDISLFTTTGVSLYQIIEQGGLIIPPFTDFDLFPRADDVNIEVLAP